MKRGACIFALAALLAGWANLPTLGADAPTTAPATQGGKAVIIQLQGEIDDFNRDALFRRFDEARKLGANVVILDIDSYGGVVLDGSEISRFIKRQTDLHTVAFVQDKAISAGSMVAMACDEIVVSGNARIGDCAPIQIGPAGLESLGETERAKFEAPILIEFADSAQRNHYDPLIAAGMVNMKQIIYWVQDTQGHRKFVDDKEYQKLIASKQWTDVPGARLPVKDDKSLLLLTSDQAIQYGIATGTAPSASALAQTRGYNITADLTPGTGEQLVEFLSGPVVRGVLFTIFLMALYMVIHAPGHGLGETIGVLALGLMLGIPLLTGYAQWWEILVIFLGLALVAFEILLPGHIFPGVIGGIMVLIGIIMTFVPSEPGGFPALTNVHFVLLSMERGLIVVAAGMGASLFLWFWFNRFMPRMPYVNRLILTATSGGTGLKATSPTAPTSPWPPIGGIGRAVSELKPGGSAEFYDPTIADRRMASVISESGFLPAGTEIVVRQVSPARIVVARKV